MTESDDRGRKPGADERRGDADERESDADEHPDRDHLEGLDSGAGCTEIWERLAERRQR